MIEGRSGFFFEDQAGSAVLSPCGNYRYDLLRRVSTLPGRLLVIGQNPSRADHKQDDNTVRKGKGFANLFGLGLLEFWNPFAYRSPSPQHLTKVVDPIGPGNDDWLGAAVWNATRVLVATGDPPRELRALFLKRMDFVNRVLGARAAEAVCLGRTRAGNGRHICRLAYATPVEKWIL